MAPPVILTPSKIHIAPGTKILKSDDYAQYLQGRKIIEAARHQADEIIDHAKEAYKQRRQQGYEDGLAESKVDQAEQMLKVVSRTIGYLSDVEKSMVDILLSGIKKIIGEFDQEELAVSLVKNALQHVRNEKQVTIRVPPSQYQMVQARINEILAEYKGVGFIDLVSDSRLSTGDCIMESDIGVVDASIDQQIRALQKRFDRLNSEAVKSIARDSNVLDQDT